MSKIRLTMAQALVRYLAAQKVEIDGRTQALFAGVWAIAVTVLREASSRTSSGFTARS